MNGMWIRILMVVMVFVSSCAWCNRDMPDLTGSVALNSTTEGALDVKAPEVVDRRQRRYVWNEAVILNSDMTGCTFAVPVYIGDEDIRETEIGYLDFGYRLHHEQVIEINVDGSFTTTWVTAPYDVNEWIPEDPRTQLRFECMLEFYGLEVSDLLGSPD